MMNNYISFKQAQGSQAVSTDIKIQACLRDITAWMVLNKLMNNADKLEALMVGTSQQLAKKQFDIKLTSC